MNGTTVIHLFYALNREPWPGHGMARALASLPLFMQDEVSTMHRWQDRQARLQGRLLLRRGLARLGLGGDLGSWSRSPSGKPRLPTGCAEFSISHTAGVTVCALALGSPLGVDAEVLKPVDHAEFKAFFSPAEMRAIQAAPSPWRELLRLWTAKEAVLKAEGIGLLGDPAGLEVLERNPILNGRRWTLIEVDLGTGHVCHLATPPGRTRVRLLNLEQAELLEGCH
jgi:4'-phosphopantetheinyl transferase